MTRTYYDGSPHYDDSPYYVLSKYRTPATHRITWNRSNSELLELVTISIKAKFKSTGPNGETVIAGENKAIDFTWSFSNENTTIELNPTIQLTYKMECEENDYTDRLVVSSEVGKSDAPFRFDVDEVISKNNISTFPCNVEFSSVYILKDDNDDLKIYTTDKGPDIYNPFQGGNGRGSYLTVKPRKYKIVIEE